MTIKPLLLTSLLCSIKLQNQLILGYLKSFKILWNSETTPNQRSFQQLTLFIRILR